MLDVRWIGYGGHALYAEALRPVINELGMKLTTIHEWDNADVKWQLGTWLNELKKADVIICPTDIEKFPAKSQNKLTQALSLGKPVICSPLNSYKEVERKYLGCCLFAQTPEDWKEQLTKVRDNPQLRQDLGQKGLMAAKEYHIDKMAAKWLGILTETAKVDIVIPTYNNARGLKLCIDSIRACTDTLHNVYVVNNGDNQEIHDYLQQQADVIYIKQGRMTFAQAVNIGIKAGQSKYVCILNDDVIVSKGWLRELVKSGTSGIGAVGPLSNCDKGWLHNYDINVAGVELLPGINTFEQIEPIQKDLYEVALEASLGKEEIIQRDWVAFYCTLIPRGVINKMIGRAHV